MKTRIISTSVVVCLVLMLGPASWAQHEPSYKELPNFHRVSDRLYRGAQPRDGAIRTLSELGIKTVINLRGASERIGKEQKETESAGLRYFNIPMPGLSAPSDEQVARVMAIIDDPNSQPVFIHCKRGSDRTGTIAAIYRILRDGWTAERAIAEAKKYGMSWAAFGLRSYISKYSKQQLKHNQPAPATSH